MNKVIQSNHITLKYENSENIINKSSISINSGEFVFITGPSGSGKSTLLKSFYGAIEPLEGTLVVGGVDLTKISTKKLNFLRQHIGIIFQDYKLIKDWSVTKNIMLPLMISGYAKDVSESQVNKLLHHVKLHHHKNRFPLELSGGEQQRVAMARALAHNPVLILADEPTGNLDEYSSRLIWDLLEGANEQLKTTVVVVTHHIPERMHIEYRHYHLENGTIYAVN